MDTMRAKKRRPTHPGEVLREDVLPVLGLTGKSQGNDNACACIEDIVTDDEDWPSSCLL